MAKGLNSFHLKIIGIVTMFIDHWGYIISDKSEWMRDVGRLSFIIFAFLLAEGFKHTSDKKRYVLGFLIAGVTLQLPQLFVKTAYMNIFLTLFLGSGVLYLKEYYSAKVSIIGIIIFSVLSYLLSFDYPVYGIILPLLFYMYTIKNKKLYILLALVTIISIKMNFVMDNQYLSFLALPLIYFYNGKEGRKMKLFFYLFYPIHLIFIELIRILFFFIGEGIVASCELAIKNVRAMR